MNIEESNLIEGEINPDFHKEECTHLLDEHLIEFFKHFRHTDTYFKRRYDGRSSMWRVQGWIYISDLPDIIPQQLIDYKENCEITIRKGRAIVEVRSLPIESLTCQLRTEKEKEKLPF